MLLLDENGNIQRVDDPPGRYDLPERQEDDRLYDLMVQNGTGTPMKCEKRLRATLKQRKKPDSAFCERTYCSFVERAARPGEKDSCRNIQGRSECTQYFL